MRMYDIIYKKRNSVALSADEINFVVGAYTKGEIPDYQMAAFLMAVFIRGMDESELAVLTRAMTNSGEVMDLSDIKGPKIDKHSTGGVGDGISLALAPLAASCGVIVPMMSGRGLGHTGGTLDKLESIPGFRVDLSANEFKKQLEKIGVAIIGQTEKVAPADKKIYALRDVTATVDSIPLIAASIMSKKLAEGADGLILDVKTGSGAFMKTFEDSKKLAEVMVSIGRESGKKMRAVISDMNQPLGRAVGNSLEIEQTIDVLKGKGPEDFRFLVTELAARMVVMADIEKNPEDARALAMEKLSSGDALRVFAEMVKAQGGDPDVVQNPQKVLPRAKFAEDIKPPRDGYITAVKTDEIGMCSLELGAGRASKEDKIDYSAGIILHKKIGDRVSSSSGEPLATFYYNKLRTPDLLEETKKRFTGCFEISDSPPQSKLRMIYDEIK